MAKDKVYTEEELKAYDNLIKELREAFKKLKCQELVDILAQYKKESNEELSDLVLSWNTYYESRVNNDDDDNNTDVDSVNSLPLIQRDCTTKYNAKKCIFCWFKNSYKNSFFEHSFQNQNILN